MRSEVSDRSFVQIRPADLRRLDEIAREDLDNFFRESPIYAVYRDRLLMTCLCQGAAQHWVDNSHGVKDFDVWAFFMAHPDRPFPARRRKARDFQDGRFGRHPADEGYTGRRVDILGRSVMHSRERDPVQSVLAWLTGSTVSAKHLRRRPVVLLPLGEVIYCPASGHG
jgi:hypothetical protein